MKEDGVKIHFKTKTEQFENLPNGEIKVTFNENGEEKTKSVDTVLIAVGRTPNIENLGLEAAGIEFDRFGIKVNNYLQTANESIYAIGDCIPGLKFTHNSDIHARYAVRNSLFFG